MATVRVFFQNKRMATGKEWKGKFLQVYPSLKEYSSESVWRKEWEASLKKSISFQKAPSPSPTPAPAPSKKKVNQTPAWTYRNEVTCVAPAGTYYIGDLCYALSDKIYDNVFGSRGYEQGYYSNGTSFFMVAGTAYGDGLYRGSDGYGYAVDAGIIGICSEDLIDTDSKSIGGGKIHTFTEPVRCYFTGGVFRFTSGWNQLTIDTLGSEEDEYEEDR